MSLYTQSPTSRELYSIDWTPSLVGAATVSSVAVTCADPSVVIDGVTTQSPITNFYVSGGVHAGLYVVKALATLSDGQKVPAWNTFRMLA